MIMVLSKPRLEVSGGDGGAAAELERRLLGVASQGRRIEAENETHAGGCALLMLHETS